MRTDCALNIILIGMPGAGKSTVGVLLAKRLGYHFIDTDLLIQVKEKNRLQQLIVEQGMTAFKQMEANILCELEASHSVIATGGSAIYSEMAMTRIKRLGRVVFLDIPLETLQARILDMDSRGLVIDPGETFEQLYRNRRPLYEKHADLTIDGSGMLTEQLAAAIEQSVCQHPLE